ncbi:MAG: hypothetical protein V7724_03495 [Sediminicola sp.]
MEQISIALDDRHISAVTGIKGDVEHTFYGQLVLSSGIRIKGDVEQISIVGEPVHFRLKDEGGG